MLRRRNTVTKSLWRRKQRISSDLKHGTIEASGGSWSYSNRRDQRSCCTAMWKSNGKTAALLLFVDSPFPKTATNARHILRGKNIPK
jgi:hypothetical protein